MSKRFRQPEGVIIENPRLAKLAEISESDGNEQYLRK